MPTMTKPMTEKQFNFAVSLTAKAYTDPSERAERLLHLAGLDFYSISPVIDELKLKVATTPKPAAPAAPAATVTYTPPKAYYLVDGTVYQLKPSKYGSKMFVYVDGDYFGTWGFGKTNALAGKLATPEMAMAATIAYAEKTTRCGVCNTKLTDPKSIAAKIGPICAKKYA